MKGQRTIGSLSDVEAPPTASAPRELSFRERIAGEWKLNAWTEAGGPTTLYIDVKGGTMKISDRGGADWHLNIDERGESHRPQPAVRCGGSLTLAEKIEAEPGAPQNSTIDWTRDLQSADYSSTGKNLILRTMCGWSNIGDRDPFAVRVEGDRSRPATLMEASNRWGLFRWER